MRAFLYSKGQNLRVHFGLFMLLLLLPLVEAQQISSVSPRTATVGEPFELEVSGKNLGLSGDGNLLILASFGLVQRQSCWFVKKVSLANEALDVVAIA